MPLSAEDGVLPAGRVRFGGQIHVQLVAVIELNNTVIGNEFVDIGDTLHDDVPFATD